MTTSNKTHGTWEKKIYSNNIIRTSGCVVCACEWKRSEVKTSWVRSEVLLVSKKKMLKINHEREEALLKSKEVRVTINIPKIELHFENITF